MRVAILCVFFTALCLTAAAQKPTEQESNKEVARNFFEQVLDQGHLEKYAESHAPDFVAHGSTHEALLRKTWPPPEKSERPCPTCA